MKITTFSGLMTLDEGAYRPIKIYDIFDTYGYADKVDDYDSKTWMFVYELSKRQLIVLIDKESSKVKDIIERGIK